MGGSRQKKNMKMKIMNNPDELCMTNHQKKFYLFLIRTDRLSNGDNIDEQEHGPWLQQWRLVKAKTADGKWQLVTIGEVTKWISGCYTGVDRRLDVRGSMINNYVHNADSELVQEIARSEKCHDLVRGSEIVNTSTDKSGCMYHIIVFGVKEPQRHTFTKLKNLMNSIVDGQYVDRRTDGGNKDITFFASCAASRDQRGRDANVDVVRRGCCCVHCFCQVDAQETTKLLHTLGACR